MIEKIKVHYTASDGYRETKSFRSIVGASRYSRKTIGDFPEMGSYYAVSGDGVGKITCEGCKLSDLFPGA